MYLETGTLSTATRGSHMSRLMDNLVELTQGRGTLTEAAVKPLATLFKAYQSVENRGQGFPSDGR
jgi:hypothetical protein